MRKGMLEYCVMLILRHEACYAANIIDRLKQADMILVEGTLYPLLSRLKRDKLLAYHWEESPQGPPRKYYRLTEQGEQVMSELDAVWSELANTVKVLRDKPADDASTVAEQTSTADSTGRGITVKPLF